MSTSTRHARTRSSRVQVTAPAPKPRHATQPSGVFSIDAASSSSSSAAVGSTSSLSIFLTSIKLLDLDLLPDWPAISVETFAGTVSGANLKKRIQAVEWSLFQLFKLWDPEETASKLKPFFPPLDQVQSINLRAALLRALEHAKKNGVLGRDAILRKTMLDECKGERLEEVLAAFSVAVLKKVVSDDMAANGQDHSLAITLAFENRGYKGERTELQVLNLAHRVKLRKLLERRGAANARYRDFADLLSVKERNIARRSEEIREKREAAVTAPSSDTITNMRRRVRNNWTGDEHWMEALLHGGAAADKDQFMAMPFDRVWRRVEQGRLSELEESSAGLLEQLEARVRVQNERLQKWKTLQRSIGGSKPEFSPSKPRLLKQSTRGINFGFDAHTNLQSHRRSPSKGSAPLQLTGEYAELVQSLQEKLKQEQKGRPSALKYLTQMKGFNRNHNQPDPFMADEDMDGGVSEMSELEDECEVTPPAEQPRSPVQRSVKRQPVRPRLSYSEDPVTRSASPSSAFIRRRPTAPDDDFEIEVSITSSPAASPERQTQPPRRAPSPIRIDESPEEPELDVPPSPTQQLADQILEDIQNASPSPSKRPRARQTLSLTERTRLSMTRGSSMFLEDEPELPTPTSITIPEEAEEPSHISGTTEDLVSRTRKSMMGFEKAQQKAQLERRRSQRKPKAPPRREGSYFPKVAEDDTEDQTILAEELMKEEDMEAVFRSRPKIQASPQMSPTREWHDDDI